MGHWPTVPSVVKAGASGAFALNMCMPAGRLGTAKARRGARVRLDKGAWSECGIHCVAASGIMRRSAASAGLLLSQQAQLALTVLTMRLLVSLLLFTCQDRYDCGPPTPFNSPAQEVPHQRTHGPSERVTPVLA